MEEVLNFGHNGFLIIGSPVYYKGHKMLSEHVYKNQIKKNSICFTRVTSVRLVGDVVKDGTVMPFKEILIRQENNNVIVEFFIYLTSEQIKTLETYKTRIESKEDNMAIAPSPSEEKRLEFESNFAFKKSHFLGLFHCDVV